MAGDQQAGSDHHTTSLLKNVKIFDDDDDEYAIPELKHPWQREAEIDRIYGTGKAGQSVRERMSGSFLENPHAESFKQLLWADVAETRTGEHFERQRVRRNLMTDRLEKEKDFIIERNRAVKKELAKVKQSSSSKGAGSSNNKAKSAPGARVTITEKMPIAADEGDNKEGQKSEDEIHFPLQPDNYPKTIDAASRQRFVHDLIRRLPDDAERLERKRQAFEYKLYHQRVAYQNQFAPSTYEPWQKENADMIRSLVYDLVDHIMDAYQGRQQEEAAAKKAAAQALSVAAAAEHKAVMAIQQLLIDETERAAIAQQSIAKLQRQRQLRADNAMLEKIAQLEGEGLIYEITRAMVADVAAEEIELLMLCRALAKTSTTKVAWALSNPSSATKGSLPDQKKVTSLEQIFKDVLLASLKSNNNK